MKIAILTLLNLGLIGVFAYLMRRPNLLTFSQTGRIWLTWLAVAIITLMDEFTSIFYAPAEAYRFIGLSAIVFIALTSILIRFMSTRFTEIAEILEHNGLIGGGVYSFSYLVLGPMMSFVAVSSIMVDYTLTACISAVSAVLNAASFFPQVSESPATRRFSRARDSLGNRRAKYSRHKGECEVYLPDFYSGRIHYPEPYCLRVSRI